MWGRVARRGEPVDKRDKCRSLRIEEPVFLGTGNPSEVMEEKGERVHACLEDSATLGSQR